EHGVPVFRMEVVRPPRGPKRLGRRVAHDAGDVLADPVRPERLAVHARGVQYRGAGGGHLSQPLLGHAQRRLGALPVTALPRVPQLALDRGEQPLQVALGDVVLRAGAQDYVTKGNLKRLLPAVERELRDARERRDRKRAEATLRVTQERLRQVTASSTAVLYATSVHGETFRPNWVSENITRIMGYAAAE